MKLRQKYAAVLAAVIIATSVPTFAASANGVNKIVTVAQDATLEGVLAPDFKIEFKDGLKKNEIFYLNLENAQWAVDVVASLGENTNFTFTRETKTRLGVEAKKDIPASQTAYRIPLLAKITGGEAAVEVDPNDTTVTKGKYVFAISNNTKGKVTVSSIDAFVTEGKLATISIEEPYIGAFKSNRPQKLRLELRGKGIELNYNKNDILADSFLGKRAYADKKFPVKIIDSTTLEVTIPANSLDSTQKGAFELTGVAIKVVKGAPYGEIKAILTGDLIEETVLTVAKYSDYGTELKVAKTYTAIAGQKLNDIEFTLTETVPNSLQGNRETRFEFPEGVSIEGVTISKSEGVKGGAEAPVISVVQEDNKNTNVFTVTSIKGESDKKISLTFKATLDIPVTFTKDITVVLEGPAVEKQKEVFVAGVETPVAVGIKPGRVKVGLMKQPGGEITLTETNKETISKGKIFFALEESAMRYTKAPDVTVTKGDLRVDGDVEIIPGGLVLTIKDESTKASTLKISGGEITVDRTVPDGDFWVRVGGPALSAYSSDILWNSVEQKHNDIDALIEETFIIVGETAVEETKNKASFVIGEAKYTVNGEAKLMDAPAYLAQEGRTMLPVRYAADALGVSSDKILWDGVNKTVTVIGDKVVQIKLGSKEMIIDKVTIPMTAAPEMKNNRVFLPVAEIARALGASVAWDGVTGTATFN